MILGTAKLYFLFSYNSITLMKQFKNVIVSLKTKREQADCVSQSIIELHGFKEQLPIILKTLDCCFKNLLDDCLLVVETIEFDLRFDP